MPNEAAQLYLKLVKEHGMPECKTLMQLGEQWYQTPEEVDGDPDQAVSTAVFRVLPEPECAGIMADHAFKWAASFAETGAPQANPIDRLRHVVALAGKR